MTAPVDKPVMAAITATSRRLLNDYQDDFPLVPRPYAAIAEQLGMSEQQVLDTLARLRQDGTVSRVGPVYEPNTVGASTLAAMAVPEDRLQTVANLISGYREVNHNYQREHAYNLWFVVTACSNERLTQILGEIGARSGLAVLDLPLLQQYHINLGFELQWT